MTKKDIKIFFTGSYQLSQAVSNLAEMVDKNGKLNVEYVKDVKNILKLNVPSRHISRTTYRCFLRYKPNSIGVSHRHLYYTRPLTFLYIPYIRCTLKLCTK
ncbi:hypothetical protein ALC62_13283 [Cyphomyrmex costatus]|uniref:Uncharacterized protein n=1 Tax=Cyphomyrmex costatus TaxID=456900 RepID=A0A151IA71_9HYME|nr:hypothetical protein ALC62_13283 [Cyphomyrmex costatus]